MIPLCGRFVVPKVQMIRVPKGSRGTLVTALIIARMIREGAKDLYVCSPESHRGLPQVQHQAEGPSRRGPCAIRLGETERPLYERCFSYGVVALRAMLELQAGDCDDISILLGQCWYLRDIRSG